MSEENLLREYALPESLVNSQELRYDPRSDYWKVSSPSMRGIDLSKYRKACTPLFFQSLKLALVVLNGKLKPTTWRTYLTTGLRPFLEKVPKPLGEITRADLEAYWIQLPHNNKHYFKYLRPLCEALHLHGIPGASITQEALEYIGSLKPGDPQTDHLVNNWDPVNGPLTPDELDGLLRALYAGFASGDVSPENFILILLLASFGARGSNLADLRICDLKIKEVDGRVKYELSIPSVKQRGGRFRQSFYSRPLGLELGVLLESYVEHQKDRYANLGCGDQLPMFVDKRNPDPIRAYHSDRDKLNQAAVRIVNRLGVDSPRTQEALHGNTRRYRYTQGTMARAMGLDPVAIAILLDHGSTETLQVYAALDPAVLKDITDRLQSGRVPLASAFLGRIADPYEVQDPRRLVFRANFRKDCPAPAVGGCEASCKCGGRQPYACYPCRLFTASMEGDHEGALADVLEDRVRFDQDAGDSLRFLTADSVAQAIRGVITKIQERLKEMGKTLDQLRQEKEALLREKGIVP